MECHREYQQRRAGLWIRLTCAVLCDGRISIRRRLSRITAVSYTHLDVYKRQGTWCVKERDVFLRDSHAHHIWTYYGEDAEHIRAYRIVVAKAEENDTHTYGEVYPINYAEQIPRIQKAALPVDRVEIHFTDDKIETV